MSDDKSTMPWDCDELQGWSIAGMNHYHMDRQRCLFVAMTNGNNCIKAEGYPDALVWEELRTKADRITDLKEKYNDLVLSVSSKWPDETRHQTAKRYIMERGATTSGVAKNNER